MGAVAFDQQWSRPAPLPHVAQGRDEAARRRRTATTHGQELCSRKGSQPCRQTTATPHRPGQAHAHQRPLSRVAAELAVGLPGASVGSARACRRAEHERRRHAGKALDVAGGVAPEVHSPLHLRDRLRPCQQAAQSRIDRRPLSRVRSAWRRIGSHSGSGARVADMPDRRRADGEAPRWTRLRSYSRTAPAPACRMRP